MERISESDVVIIERIYAQHGRVEVSKVRHIRSGRTLCMKKVFVSNIQEATAMQSEYLAMATLQHDNIVKLTAASLGGQDKTITHLLIFSEYCEEGDLKKIIKRCAGSRYFLQEDLILQYLKMLVNAFVFMQDKNIAHRDIKPQNIFVCENGSKLKVGDLGSASQQEDNNVNNIVGTPLYLSPLLRKAYSQNVQFGGVSHNVYKSDVYSLGLTFLYLASLKPVNDLINLSDMVQRTESRIRELEHSYPVLSEILKGMLADDEFFRFDFLTLRSALNKEAKVSERLDTQTYHRVAQKKGRLEFSNFKCNACSMNKREDELFVFHSGLVCFSCRASFLEGHELKNL
jgi:serine/threonine protein kinase